MQAVNNPFDNINSLFVPQPVNLSPAVHVDTLKNRLNRVIQMKDIIRDHPNLSVLANTHHELKAIEKETQEELTQTQFFADSILNVSNTTLKELQKEAGVALRPYLDHLSGLIDQIPYEVLEKQADSIPSLKKQIHQSTLLDKTGKQQLVDKLSDILRYVIYFDSYHNATEENKPFVRKAKFNNLFNHGDYKLAIKFASATGLLFDTPNTVATYLYNNRKNGSIRAQQLSDFLFQPENSEYLTAFVDKINLIAANPLTALRSIYSLIPKEAQNLDTVLTQLTKAYQEQNVLASKQMVNSFRFLINELFFLQEQLRGRSPQVKSADTWLKALEQKWKGMSDLLPIYDYLSKDKYKEIYLSLKTNPLPDFVQD